MNAVDSKQLEKLQEKLKMLQEKLPDSRRELHTTIARIIKSQVDRAIATSGLRDSGGRVAAWQREYVGSHGGYAAVRPADEKTASNSPGAITNYLNSGHKIPQPRGTAKQYTPRIHKPYVDGYHFYQSAQLQAQAKAIQEADKWLDNFVQELEDKLC